MKKGAVILERLWSGTVRMSSAPDVLSPCLTIWLLHELGKRIASAMRLLRGATALATSYRPEIWLTTNASDHHGEQPSQARPVVAPNS